jgi:hypothetical protein
MSKKFLRRERHARIHAKEYKKETHGGECTTHICRRKEEEHMRLSSSEEELKA